MESYYSSDEEIAWGPRTLREIKGDLKRPIIRKPNRRHTLALDCRLPESGDKMDQSVSDEVNKLNISGTSTTYLTPNESLQTNTTNSISSNFLEKLSEVISVPGSDLSEYVSVLEDTENSNRQSEDTLSHKETPIKNNPNIFLTVGGSNHNDTCMNFIQTSKNRETSYEIENFRQTLVENTYVLSEEEGDYEDLLTKKTNSTEEKPVTSTATNEEIIVISEDSDSSITSIDIEYISSTEGNRFFKKEIDYHTNSSNEYDESSFFEDSFEKVVSDQIYQHEVKDDLNSGERSNDAETYCEENGQLESENLGEDNFYVLPNMEQKLSTIKEFLSTSPVVVPDLNLSQFDDSFSKDESLQLNDTVEEMKRAVCQGLNYSMSDDEVVESTPAKTEHNIFNQISTDSTPAKNENKFSPQLQETKRQMPCCNKTVTSNIPKPTSASKKQYISPKTNFKVPEHKKVIKPTPIKSCPNHLKNIVSPVALYIKSSPMHPLHQNMPQRELSKIVTSTNSKAANKENYSKSEFGHVAYKPSKNQIASKSAEKHVIPSYMKKLNVKDGQIKKHEDKLRRDFRESKVSKKLLQTDLTNCTIDQSLLSDAGDISILTNKQAFVK